MHSIPLDKWAKFWAERFVCNQIDWATQMIFKVKLDPKKTLGRRWSVELDQYIHITACGRSITRGGTEQSQFFDTKLADQKGLVLSKKARCCLAIHECSLAI